MLPSPSSAGAVCRVRDADRSAADDLHEHEPARQQIVDDCALKEHCVARIRHVDLVAPRRRRFRHGGVVVLLTIARLATGKTISSVFTASLLSGLLSASFATAAVTVTALGPTRPTRGTGLGERLVRRERSGAAAGTRCPAVVHCHPLPTAESGTSSVGNIGHDICLAAEQPGTEICHDGLILRVVEHDQRRGSAERRSSGQATAPTLVLSLSVLLSGLASPPPLTVHDVDQIRRVGLDVDEQRDVRERRAGARLSLRRQVTVRVACRRTSRCRCRNRRQPGGHGVNDDHLAGGRRRADVRHRDPIRRALLARQ